MQYYYGVCVHAEVFTDMGSVGIQSDFLHPYSLSSVSLLHLRKSCDYVGSGASTGACVCVYDCVCF